MADDIQNDDLVKADLRRQERSSRSGRRSRALIRDAERCAIRWRPAASTAGAAGPERNYNFDSTAMDGLDRFDAALGAVTMPKTERWLGLTVYDKDLARIPAVQRWLEHATDRCGIACTRRTPAFGVATSEDRRALGCYGTARCGSTKPRAAGCSSARST
jgi:hypothetical protein